MPEQKGQMGEKIRSTSRANSVIRKCSLLMMIVKKSQENCNTRDAIPRASVTRSVPLRNISANDPYKVINDWEKNHNDLLLLQSSDSCAHIDKSGRL